MCCFIYSWLTCQHGWQLTILWTSTVTRSWWSQITQTSEKRLVIQFCSVWCLIGYVSNLQRQFSTWFVTCREAILEVTQGIREYFNVMLGTQLLYKFERPQYADVSPVLLLSFGTGTHFYFWRNFYFSSCGCSCWPIILTHPCPSCTVPSICCGCLVSCASDQMLCWSLNMHGKECFVQAFQFFASVKLGGMLAYTPLDEKSIQLLLTHIHDFLR